MEKQRVYLAGGFKTDWADRVKACSNNFQWINPKDKEFTAGRRVVLDVNEYGTWDLHFIKQSDIVFVYVERTNPSCIGLACEAGYAKGLGKTVITVLEPNHETLKDSHLAFITQVSDIVFETLEAGVDHLKSYGLI